MWVLERRTGLSRLWQIHSDLQENRQGLKRQEVKSRSDLTVGNVYASWDPSSNGPDQSDCEIIKKTEASRAVSGCLLPFDLQNGWFRYDTLHLQLTDYRLGVP